MAAQPSPTAPSPGRERLCERGRYFDDFRAGDLYRHHYGRTLTEAEAVAFATQTMNYNPLYFNRAFARSRGHPDVVVCPWFVFNVVLGMSVEDISEQATALLGYGEMAFHRPVYPGDTLRAESEVLETRVSASRPGQGVLKVRTRAYNQRDELVLDYVRSNLIRKRPEVKP